MIYRDPTLAIPWSMPGLFVQATAGSLIAVAAVPAFRLPISILWTAAAPIMLAMLTAISVTQRYTADFCPLLISAAAFAIAATETLPRLGRTFAQVTWSVLAVLGVLVTFALTLHHQREIVWGVPEEARLEYQRWRGPVAAPIQRHDDE